MITFILPLFALFPRDLIGSYMKFFKDCFTLVLFLIITQSCFASKPVLTIYTTLFSADWGPGPIVESKFEEICEIFNS